MFEHRKPARFLGMDGCTRSRGCDAERGVHAGPDAAAAHPEHGRNVAGDRPGIEQGRAEIATKGQEPLAGVLRSLVAHGGRVVDTWPRNADNDAGFGRVIGEPDLRDKLFVTTKIDQVGKEVGIAQFRQTQRLYGREKLDLVQIFSLTDLDTHWPSLKEWKAAGHARYIGVTVAEAGLYERLEQFLGARSPISYR